ncbi:MAG TPA: hypothetical protein VI454_16550 [Verrucomicrobiae bacterium]|jgi:hypothetical protein
MASHAESSNPAAPFQLPGWVKNLPMILMVGGGALALVGALVPGTSKQFAFSYLTAFMFFLSICLGGLFLTILHHLFDANWSVPTRRITEHLAFLLPVMAALFVPIAVKAPQIYQWMNVNPHDDHALMAKQPLFTVPFFYLISFVLFAIWALLSWKLRANSLAQDKDGDARHTTSNRKWAAGGIFLFAFTLTLAAIFWMKAIQHQFFSTMYGVYYFAGSVWTALGTLYVITLLLKRQGPLAAVTNRNTFYSIGILMFAFTVFYAYIHFSQYFLIWNAAIPEETFWYVLREKGKWWDIGMLIVFGHFVIPFLALLRIDAKLTLPLMLPLAGWMWICHYADMCYNIQPALHPDGFHFGWLDIACFAFLAGVLATVFLKYFRAHAPFPQKDPRIAETLGVYVPLLSESKGKH